MTTRTINLVLQGQYHNACQQACLAMLAGVTVEEVVSFIGDHRLDGSDRQKVCDKYGIVLDKVSYQATWMDVYRIGKMAKVHGTLLIDQFDWFDTAFGHNILLHNGQLYDPALGMNPHYPWTRVFGKSRPVISAPCK